MRRRNLRDKTASKCYAVQGKSSSTGRSQTTGDATKAAAGKVIIAAFIETFEKTNNTGII
jgi:hypothetical protein